MRLCLLSGIVNTGRWARLPQANVSFCTLIRTAIFLCFDVLLTAHLSIILVKLTNLMHKFLFYNKLIIKQEFVH